ncbi:MAG: tyrosine--tRNA ligase [Polyangiaceae bacterium]|nr:tyrosine--tRNA ligase [Polyangiaceae bacterium]
MIDPAAVIDELNARELLYQTTDEAALRDHLRQPAVVYNGFDPTADSLTVGNLVAIMLLRVFARHGHHPIVLMGGATGRIGDPSGKDTERQLLSDEQITTHLGGQRPIFERLLGTDVEIVDNDAWFREMSAYTFLREVGKHFSVNQMLARDSVKNRLEREGQGLSYTEFSYLLLQAYDFLHLHRERGVSLQTAGADQWGNIVSGVDLIRRVEGTNPAGGPRAFGLTAPLLTRADGGKFGKTEAGAIWLSHHRPSGARGTSPYGYYQFWLNTADADVRRFLLTFTDLPVAEIEALVARHASAPHEREAQRTLAREATALLHGVAAMRRAEDAARALFEGTVELLDRATLEEVFALAPATEHPRADLAGNGVALVEVLAQTTLARSRTEARKHLDAGAIALNGNRVTSIEARLTERDLLHGSVALLRRGRKAWHVTRWR